MSWAGAWGAVGGGGGWRVAKKPDLDGCTVQIGLIWTETPSKAVLDEERVVARLIAVTDAEVAERDGVISALPMAAFLRGIVPGEELWPGMVGGG